MNFKEEYEARLRRICGVTDDSLSVDVTMDGGDWEGCDTCGHGREEAGIEITVYGSENGTGFREFRGSLAFGDLIRELEEVDL